MRAIDFDLFYSQFAQRLPYFPTQKKNIRSSALGFFNWLKKHGYIQDMNEPTFSPDPDIQALAQADL